MVDNIIHFERLFDCIATGAAKIATAQQLVVGFSAQWPCGALVVLFFEAARLVTPVVLRFGFLNACSELQVLHRTRTGWPALRAMMTCKVKLAAAAVGIDIVTSAVHGAFYSLGVNWQPLRVQKK